MSTTESGRAFEASYVHSTDEAVGHHVQDIVDRSKSASADAAAGVARAAETIANSVAGESPALAEYVRGAGQKIDRLASDLRDKKVGELLSSAAEFGRSQPVVLLAGAALVGFALSRLVKAGVAAPSPAEAQAPATDPWRSYQRGNEGESIMVSEHLGRPGVVTLATAAFAQTADLLQAEFRLARAELAEKMSAIRSSLIMLLLGAIFLIVALGMILQALASALIEAGVSPPAAILLVAGGAAVLGLVLFLVGHKRLNHPELTPNRTLNSLSRDSRMVKETLT